MKKNLLGLLALAVTVSGVASARSIMLPQLENVTVKSVTLTGDFMPGPGRPMRRNPLTVLTVQVDSNGCTDESSFRVDVKPTIQGKQLTIVRIRPDHCRAFFPEGTEVELTTGFVGFGEQVFIGNPVRLINNTTH